MIMSDIVTNKALYEAIMDIHKKIDEVVDKRIGPLERTVDKLWLYASIGGTIAGFIMTMSLDWVKGKFFKT